MVKIKKLKMKYYILLFLTAAMGVVSAQQKDNDTITKIKIEEKINLPFGELTKDRLVGAVDVITADDLSHTSDYNVESALAGLASGLIITKGNGEPGIDNTFMSIRGRSRGGNDFPLVVIDGIANRALSSIALDEVESIQVLKDVTAKMLYGSMAANGVIMVNTKRGYDGKKKVTFFTESGIKSPTRLPEYLNSADYATSYNQALINDGLKDDTNGYTQEQIDAYRNNPSILNPDVDFLDTFLKKSTTFRRFNAQLIGGDENTKYFLNLGYVGEDGLEKVGTQQFNRLNLRGNIDYKVNDVVSMFIDIAGRMDIWDDANVTNNEFFGALSSHRPNDYPLFVGDFGDTDALGWSQRVPDNLYGELTRTGYVNSKNYYSQSNVGLNFDLNRFVDGLKAGAYVTFDSYNNVRIGKNLDYISYDPVTLEPKGEEILQGEEVRRGDNFQRNVGLVGTIDYNKSWENNDLQINFSSVTQTLSRKSVFDSGDIIQDNKNINFGLRVNYMFKNKYVIEGTSSYMGSDKFTKENRWGLFGAAGLGWIMSNEDFLKNSNSINYLKLKGSFGVMGYDRGYDYLLDRDFYASSGNFRTGTQNQNVDFGFRQSQIGNVDLTFEKSREFNIGIESSLFNNTVALEVNYFNELRYDIPTTLNTVYPDYILGDLSVIGNFNEVSNKGVDLSISYSNNIGNDFRYSFGGNLLYSKSVNEVVDEINAYEHQNNEGVVTDAIRGFKANGLYQNQAEIDASGVTSSFGDVIPGDINYENFINDRGDNIIDNFDQQVIGNFTPRVNYSLNLKFNYKNIEFFALGQGASGFDRMLNNSYYWNTGENKYSVQALGSAVPGSVAGASSPRLTSLSQGHSYRNSTYWLVAGDFFKLRTAELSYTLPEAISSKIGSNNFKVFVRGNDLFTISKIKDSDPENLNAGVTTYPMYTTISLGLKLTY